MDETREAEHRHPLSDRQGEAGSATTELGWCVAKVPVVVAHDEGRLMSHVVPFWQRV